MMGAYGKVMHSWSKQCHRYYTVIKLSKHPVRLCAESTCKHSVNPGHLTANISEYSKLTPKPVLHARNVHACCYTA